MAPAESVDYYLSSVPPGARAALERLRGIIKAAAPDATEGISYRIPVFKYRGMLVGFAAYKDHCSFFTMSPSVMVAFEDDLSPYDTSKGTIRFPVSKPLPVALVRKLVKARIAENEARHGARRARPR